MRLVRDLGRRKLRSTLTITGIMIGIMALVVFGSMANKIDALVKGGSTYYKDKVVVSAKGGYMGLGGVLSTKMADQVAALGGVDVVVPGVELLLSDDQSGVSMGTPPMINGSVAGADKGRETFQLNYATGRALTAQDEGRNVVVLGSDLARQFNARVGETVTLRGVKFNVVGILEPTLTAPDNSAMVPMAAAQQLFIKTLPALVADKLDLRRYAHDRGGLRPGDQRRDLDAQRDPHRHRPDQLARRRTVGHQHHGHVGGRADPRNRYQAGHRSLPLAHPPGDRDRVGAHRPDRRPSRAGARLRHHDARQRCRPRLGHDPLRPDPRDGILFRRLRHDPGRHRRLHPGLARLPDGPGDRASIRVVTAAPHRH